jgi:hypothetical protein
LEILEGVLAVAVIGLVIWIVFGSRPESRAPVAPPRERFVDRDENDLRRTGSS